MKLTDEQRSAIGWMDRLCEAGMYGDRIGAARDLLRELLAAPVAADAAAPSEDAYVAQRMTETLAEVYATIIGADAQQEDESLNAIERVKRAAQVLRLEVDLYRAQRNEAAAVQPDERAAFDTWARQHRMDAGVSLEGHYTDPATAYAWAAWRERATAPQATVMGDEAQELFPYQKTFNAIAAATTGYASGHVGISVIKFREAFGNARAAVPQAGALTDERIVETLTIPGLNVEASLEPRELALLCDGVRAPLATHPEGNRTPIDGDRKEEGR